MFGGSFGWPDLRYIFTGTLVTVELIIAAIVLGTPIGLVFGIARSNHRSRTLRTIAAVYIEAFRATPLMVQLLVIYFGIGMLGFDMPKIYAADIGLALYAGASIAEIFRGGIEAVHREQWEAAASLGMNYWQDLRYVIIPQTIRLITPPLIGFFIGLVKGTSFASIIGAVDLMLAARRVAERIFQPLLVMTIAAAIYFMICYPLSILGKKIERSTLRGNENG